MNILFIGHERNLGGASKSLVTLATELKEKGHNVFVILPIKFGQLYRELKEKKIPVKIVFYGWWMYPAEWNPFMKFCFFILHLEEYIPVARITHYAKKHKIQLIHSNSSTIDIGAKVAQKVNIPHIWHFREFGDLDYNLKFMLGKEKSCEYVGKNSAKIIFISKKLYQYYINEMLEAKSIVVYNGISEQYLIDKYSKKNDRVKKRVVFLISGNLHRNKKQDLVIKACKILLNEKIYNFQIIIAGAASNLRDSKIYEKELKELASDIPDNYIEFKGYVKDMKILREESDVEIVCSSMEAFGRVTVEAMLASNPVIASNAGANPELIEDGKNGFLFQEGNIKELADQMKKLISNPNLISHMGSQAYKIAKSSFSSKLNTEKIESIYKEILK